jgi:hypothetical protein
MRINDTGLDQLQPTIQSLINTSFNVQSLILAANPIISNYCIGTLPFIGCIGHINVNATSVTYNQPVGVDLDAQSGSTRVNVAVNNIRVNYTVSGAVAAAAASPLPSRLWAATTIRSPPTRDQHQREPAGDVSVDFTSFNNNFTTASATR